MNEPWMLQFTVYENPRDYPHKFVVREWRLYHEVDEPVPGPLLAVVDSLEEARAAIPDGLSCLPRFENDDANIAEVWL